MYARIDPDGPVGVHFVEGKLFLSALLDGFGIAHVVVSLKRLGDEAPQFGRFLGLLFVANYDKEFTSTGILLGSLPAALAPLSNSPLCCFQVFGSVIRPSAYWPARRIALGPFAAINRGIGFAGGSYSRALTS